MKSNEIESKNGVEIIILACSIIFFAAAVYGVQRSILSIQTQQDVSFTKWVLSGLFLSAAASLIGFGLTKAAMGTISGILVDRSGFFKVASLGATLFVISPTLASLWTNPLITTFSNLLLGMGEGILYTAVSIQLGQMVSSRKRATMMSIMELSIFLGYSIGALTPGIKVIHDTLNPFLIASIFGGLAAILTFSIKYFPFTHQKKSKKNRIKSRFSHDLSLSKNLSPRLAKLLPRLPVQPEELIKKKYSGLKPLHNRLLVTISLNGHVSKFADAVIVLFLPILLVNFRDFSLAQAALVSSAFTFAWALAMPFSGRLSDTFGRKPVTLVGLVGQAIAVGQIISGTSFFSTLSAVALMGIFSGLYYPANPSAVLDMTPRPVQGKLMGIYRASKDLGYVTAPPLSAILVYLSLVGLKDVNLAIKMPFLIVQIALIIAATNTFFFGIETRPAWWQYQTSLEHALTCLAAVDAAVDGMRIYLRDSDHPFFTKNPKNEEIEKEAREKAIDAKHYEVIADELLDQIAMRTYQTIQTAADAPEFIKIARRFDRVAGLSVGATMRLRKIEFDLIPEFLRVTLIRQAKGLRELMNHGIQGLALLEHGIDQIEYIYKKTRKKEKHLDDIYLQASRYLYSKADYLSFGTWMSIHNVIEILEQAADTIEDAVEGIRMLSLKYVT